jgi:hypothetical protein
MEKGTVDMEPRLQLLMMGGNVTRVRVDTRFNRSIKSIIESAHSKDPFETKRSCARQNCAYWGQQHCSVQTVVEKADACSRRFATSIHSGRYRMYS